MSAPARNGSVGRSFDGRSVVVTGAAGGIGCAVAAGFARRGASVLIGDIDADRVSAAVERIGLGVRGQVLDVRSVDSFTSFLATAEDAQGPLDIVVNNPGVDWMGPFDTQPLSAMTREVEVNLVGIINGSPVLRCCRAPGPPRQRCLGGGASQPGSAVYGTMAWS